MQAKVTIVVDEEEEDENANKNEANFNLSKRHKVRLSIEPNHTSINISSVIGNDMSELEPTNTSSEPLSKTKHLI